MIARELLHPRPEEASVSRRRPSRVPNRAARPAGTEGPAPPRRKPGVALAIGAVALAAAAAFALWVALGRRAPSPVDPAATLDPVVAYNIGLKLGRASRFAESLPYFRRAADAPGGTTWQARHDYSSSLHNATLESRMIGRFGQRVTRSSVERVAMMHESLRQLDLAQAEAGSAHDRAFLEAMRGNTLATWGFPLEALACYGRAVALDPKMKAAPAAQK